MYKACSRCGRVHDTAYQCNHNKTYKATDQRAIRNKYAWHKKSQEIREKAKYLCEVCKDENKFTYKCLSTHHIVSIKEDKERFLDNYNLICLCDEHHKLAEIGKIDKDYLFELARQREDR